MSRYTPFIRREPAPLLPPPPRLAGPLGWVRVNLFGSLPSTLATLAAAALLLWALPPLWSFFIAHAVTEGADRTACAITMPGACYPYLSANLAFFAYGFYPEAERWRADLTGLVGVIAMVLMLWPDFRHRAKAALFFFFVFPFIAFVLLYGGWFGLIVVETNNWGGIIVTLVVAVTGIVVSLPLGILLALGRRSPLPAVRFFSIVFIEFWRGVPLVTVLFMANVMLPLFVPLDYAPDKLVRALIGVALFASAYMAEVVRGGLQAVPKGQYEGAAALGLDYRQTMIFIILPQALRMVIPGIVNTFIGLFKDTSLVFIMGLIDFLKAVQMSLVNPEWASPWTLTTGYAFAALFYFAACYGMSLYALAMEKRLDSARSR